MPAGPRQSRRKLQALPPSHYELPPHASALTWANAIVIKPQVNGTIQMRFKGLFWPEWGNDAIAVISGACSPSQLFPQFKLVFLVFFAVRFQHRGNIAPTKHQVKSLEIGFDSAPGAIPHPKSKALTSDFSIAITARHAKGHRKKRLHKYSSSIVSAGRYNP